MPDLSEIRQRNLEKIFYPDSVAVVGANKVRGTVPCDILFNILKADFNGVVFPVSPREKFIAGVKAHKYVIDIPDPVDLAILVFPSSVCHLALEQCGQKGITSAIVISAGFKEVGEDGLKRERQLIEIARKYDMSFIGPNCLGVINTDRRSKINASFARRMPEEGSIGFLSQSGALCTAVLDYAYAKHIGFSKFVSFGNKADISEIDLLYYLANDPKTNVILLYLEEVADGPGLMRAARDVISSTGKPILAIKSGRTAEGASAAASHTGSLAGADEICDAALRQAGIIRCDNIEQMFNIAIAFAYQPAPPSNRVAIVTNAGGPGVLTTDAAIKSGLRLARFSEATTKVLKKNLPVTANIKNPIDVIGDARADRYSLSITTIFQDEDVDGIFVILTPQSMTDIDAIAREIAKVAHNQTKPIYTSFMGEADVAAGVDILQRHKIPHYTLPESMCAAMAQVHSFNQHVQTPQPEPQELSNVDTAQAARVIELAAQQGRTYLPEPEALEVLKAYGLPVPDSGVAGSEEEAVTLAGKLGYPVVMKVVSDDVVHKSDVKGVVVGIASDEEAREAYRSIHANVEEYQPDATVKGILVTQMLTGGEEVILGAKRDPSFGPVVMYGLGGIFVEVFGDVAFRVVPLDDTDAKSMIQETRGHQILTGARGRAPRDLDAVRECIKRLGRLALDYPQIQELDINPLIVLDQGKGCFLADARILLETTPVEK